MLNPLVKGLSMQELNDLAVHNPKIGWSTVLIAAGLSILNWFVEKSSMLAEWVPVNIVWMGGVASVALSITIIVTKWREDARQERRSERQARKTELEIQLLQKKVNGRSKRLPED